MPYGIYINGENINKQYITGYHQMKLKITNIILEQKIKYLTNLIEYFKVTGA